MSLIRGVFEMTTKQHERGDMIIGGTRGSLLGEPSGSASP